jgi:predicted nucleotidyltransferase
MDFVAVFQFLVESFRRENIDFALIGGFALQAAGLSRTTKDVDLLILSENTPQIKQIMSAHKYELLHESHDILNFISADPDLGRVDFLLAHRKYTLAMLKRAVDKEIFGGRFKIKVLKAEDLIGLKVQASSNDPKRWPQDMADIEALLRLQGDSIDESVLKEYFGLFGRADELENLLKKVKDA